jgi:hypothetical protein
MDNDHQEIERGLLPRLQVLGFILLGFGLIAFTWAVLYSPYPPPLEDLLDEKEASLGMPVSEPKRLNFFAVSAIFTTVGLSCLVFVKRRSKEPES